MAWRKLRLRVEVAILVLLMLFIVYAESNRPLGPSPWHREFMELARLADAAATGYMASLNELPLIQRAVDNEDEDVFTLSDYRLDGFDASSDWAIYTYRINRPTHVIGGPTHFGVVVNRKTKKVVVHGGK